MRMTHGCSVRHFSLIVRTNFAWNFPGRLPQPLQPDKNRTSMSPVMVKSRIFNVLHSSSQALVWSAHRQRTAMKIHVLKVTLSFLVLLVRQFLLNNRDTTIRVLLSLIKTIGVIV